MYMFWLRAHSHEWSMKATVEVADGWSIVLVTRAVIVCLLSDRLMGASVPFSTVICPHRIDYKS